MWEQILPALRINLFATVVFGLVYPLAVTGICQLFFPHQANGPWSGWEVRWSAPS